MFSNAIVKMKRLRKTSHVADQQTLFFFFNYLYVSSHKHTNLKERYHAPLILYKRAQLKHVNSLLYVCMLNWSQRLKWQFSVRCERHMTAAKFKIINKKKCKRESAFYHFYTTELIILEIYMRNIYQLLCTCNWILPCHVVFTLFFRGIRTIS